MGFEFIQQELRQRKEANLYRSHAVVEQQERQWVTIAGKAYLNFSSNDYLGMTQCQTVAKQLQGELDSIGSGGSPVVTGYSKHHQALSDFIAEGVGRQSVLLFSSGFAANSAVSQTLMSHKNSIIIADKLSHASLIDGAQSSTADLIRFKHNDLNHLQQILARESVKEKQHKLIVTEGVFSMDGDQSPISQISELSSQANAWTMLDDAHGLGVLGENGWGTVDKHHLSESNVPILMGTFGKAVGTGGAFVAGSKALIDYLRNFARHYVYSTSFSPMHAQATLLNLKYLTQTHEPREKLLKNIAFFKQQANSLGLATLGSDTAIQPVIIGNPERALKVSEALKKAGYWVTAIRTPTVPKGTDRLRITLTSLHQKQDISGLLQVLAAEVQSD